MLNGISLKIDKALYKRGFRLPQIRSILRVQILFGTASLIAGVCLAPFTMWVLWFAIGAVFAGWSLFSLARFIQQAMLQGWSRQLLWGLLFRFYGRLLLTGLILFGLVVWLRISISALVAGLATTMAIALACQLLAKGKGKAGQKIKEA